MKAGLKFRLQQNAEQVTGMSWGKIHDNTKKFLKSIFNPNLPVIRLIKLLLKQRFSVDL